MGPISLVFSDIQQSVTDSIFKRWKGVCGDFDCDKQNDFDCAESKHTDSLTSPNGYVCQKDSNGIIIGNDEIPGEDPHGHCSNWFPN